MRCDHCEMLSINGVPCHETGCPAAWRQHRECFECGQEFEVFNIRPHVYWHKGDAVAWIANRIGRPDALIVYLGDDVTDEDAFAALPEGITVKVGDPPETTAHYHLDDPATVRQFLEWLIQHAGTVPEPAWVRFDNARR